MHANAGLTPRARLRIAQLVVDHGWPVARAAERFQVAWPTAKRWADRYRQLGEAGMQDRSSRPLRQPTRTQQPVVRRIVQLRWKRRLGPVGIASVLGLPASTVHAVLARHHLSRLAWMDRPTGQVIRRYERNRPGELVHVDVKKLGRLREGGGWRVMTTPGWPTPRSTPTRRRPPAPGSSAAPPPSSPPTASTASNGS